jgi:hypothetical protein
MRKLLIVAGMVVAIAVGGTSDVRAEANANAPCIGEGASSQAPGGGFGQTVVKPEATQGLTGGVARSGAQNECTAPSP